MRDADTMDSTSRSGVCSRAEAVKSRKTRRSGDHSGVPHDGFPTRLSSERENLVRHPGAVDGRKEAVPHV